MEREKGFALVETVILGAILTVASLICLSFAVLNEQHRRNEAEVTAVFLAQEQMALAEAKPAAYLRSATSLPWLGDGANPVVRNHVAFEIATEIAGAEGSAFLRDIRVAVRWPERGTVREKRFHRLVSVRE